MHIDEIKTFADFNALLRQEINRLDKSRLEVLPDDIFNQLALALFALQFAHNAPYQTVCRARKLTPQTVKSWREIPAIPTASFKEFELTSLPVGDRQSVFHSSGTTEQRPSRHFHNDVSLSIYEASLLPWFRIHLLAGVESPRYIFLTPPPKSVPHSSLVHMFETIRVKANASDDSFTGFVDSDGAWNLDFNAIKINLETAIAKNEPVIVLGTAFNFVHLLDQLEANGPKFRLPPSSRVLETGGYKGRSRTLPKTELHSLITKWLGIPADRIVCEYGMSELSSQAYDCIAGQNEGQRVFKFPPWARAQLVSAETGHEVFEGETGLIRIFDLANVYSAMALQTEDLGIRRGDGFELVGRMSLAEARGCSLMSA